MAALLDILAPTWTSLIQDLQSSRSAVAIGVADVTHFPRVGAEEAELFQAAGDMLGTSVRRSGVYVEGHLELSGDPALFDAICHSRQKEAWKRYLNTCGGDIRSLADLVAWQETHRVSSRIPFPVTRRLD